MDQNVEFLNYIYQNAKMGQVATDMLIKTVKDQNLKQDLQTQHNAYTNFYNMASQQLANFNNAPKDIGTLSKVGTYASIKINTLVDNDASHIAEILIEGSSMGVVDLTKNINRFKDTAPEVKNLAQDVVQFEQNNIERLKTYLQ